MSTITCTLTYMKPIASTNKRNLPNKDFKKRKLIMEINLKDINTIEKFSDKDVYLKKTNTT